MIEELSCDYVRTARAKGLSESAVLFRHAFRNALTPILTILGLQFGTLLAGAIVTETIFSWPGIGRLAVQAIESRDYPLLQGCILLIAVSYVVVNLVTDLVARWLTRGCDSNEGLRDFLRQSGPGRWGFALTLLLVVLAIAAPWIAPADPTAQNLAARLLAPVAAHWMGTDELGRDVLSRILTAHAFRCS